MMEVEMQIVSNLKNLGTNITLKMPNKGVMPNAAMSEILQQLHLQYPDALVVIGVNFVGRRVLENYLTKEIVKLVQGRRHRVYFGAVYKNITKISFGWHKIKNFSPTEEAFVLNNWENEFFAYAGKHLIKMSGGVLFPEILMHAVQS